MYGDPRYFSGGHLEPYGYDGNFTRCDEVARPRWEERLAAVALWSPDGRLLEIGPGTGGVARSRRLPAGT